MALRVQAPADDSTGSQHGEVGHLSPQLLHRLLPLGCGLLLGPVDDALGFLLSGLEALRTDSVGLLGGTGNDLLCLAAGLPQRLQPLLVLPRGLLSRLLGGLQALTDLLRPFIQHVQYRLE